MSNECREYEDMSLRYFLPLGISIVHFKIDDTSLTTVTSFSSNVNTGKTVFLTCFVNSL